MPTYNIYLDKDTTVGTGVDCTDYVWFRCTEIQDAIVVQDKIKNIAGHTSYKIKLAKVLQSAVLKNCVIVKTGHAVTSTSEYYNAVKTFVLNHMVTGDGKGYDLYLFVYDPSGGGVYIKFMDNNEEMQDYCKVEVQGWNFNLKHSGVYKGNLMLKECWL